jgi:dihydrofolate reductase
LRISAIVAAAKNGVIGKNNGIPWYLQSDLKFFKKTTLNHHVIMGRNSFESIGRPLPNRTNIIITRNAFFTATGCIVAHSLNEALKIAESNDETEAFIIGGGNIYAQAMPILDRIYLTVVEAEVDGDVFFPEINEKEWRIRLADQFEANEKNDFNFVIKVLDRIKETTRTK